MIWGLWPTCTKFVMYLSSQYFMMPRIVTGVYIDGLTFMSDIIKNKHMSTHTQRNTYTVHSTHFGYHRIVSICTVYTKYRHKILHNNNMTLCCFCIITSYYYSIIVVFIDIKIRVKLPNNIRSLVLNLQSPSSPSSFLYFRVPQPDQTETAAKKI